MRRAFILTQLCREDPDYLEVTPCATRWTAIELACATAEDEFLGKGSVRRQALNQHELDVLDGMADSLMDTGVWDDGNYRIQIHYEAEVEERPLRWGRAARSERTRVARESGAR